MSSKNFLNLIFWSQNLWILFSLSLLSDVIEPREPISYAHTDGTYLVMSLSRYAYLSFLFLFLSLMFFSNGTVSSKMSTFFFLWSRMTISGLSAVIVRKFGTVLPYSNHWSRFILLWSVSLSLQYIRFYLDMAEPL